MGVVFLSAALIHLLEIDVVVLDEVDSLLEMGFEDQVVN